VALTATVHRVAVTLSDVDRSVYESLELRLARHPSESARYLLTRLFAYCLSYAEGIAFSKGGVSSADEPPVSIHDPTGRLVAWIDVGSPSAERLHRASKAAERVEVYTHADLAPLRKEAASRPIHRAEDIAVWRLEPRMLDALEAKLERSMEIELARNDGGLYVTVGGGVIEGTVAREGLV
jgi:uncharacterized protein YaeQ